METKFEIKNRLEPFTSNIIRVIYQSNLVLQRFFLLKFYN